jgi:hypothetical protein
MGHEGTRERRYSLRISVEKPEWRRQLIRPVHGWEDNIKVNLTRNGVCVCVFGGQILLKGGASVGLLWMKYESLGSTKRDEYLTMLKGYYPFTKLSPLWSWLIAAMFRVTPKWRTGGAEVDPRVLLAWSVIRRMNKKCLLIFLLPWRNSPTMA